MAQENMTEMMTIDLTDDTKERLNQVVQLSLKQIEDLHKTRDFIVERAYKFLGFTNIVFALVVTGLQPQAIVKVSLLVSFIVVLWFLRKVIDTSEVKTQGVKPSVIDLDIHKNCEGVFIDLGRKGFVLSETTPKSKYYAWLLNELDMQWQHIQEANKQLVRAYKKAQTISIICASITLTIYALTQLGGLKSLFSFLLC